MLIFSVVEGQTLFTVKEAGVDWSSSLVNNNEPDVAVFENKIVIGTNYRVLNSDHTQYTRKEIAIYVSADFGVTWSAPIILPKTNNYSKYADPSVGFDSKGNIYIAFLGCNEGGDENSAIIVNKSTDMGQTWMTEPYIITEDTSSNGEIVYDKPYIHINRNTDRVYVTFLKIPNEIMISYLDKDENNFSTPKLVNDTLNVLNATASISPSPCYYFK